MAASRLYAGSKVLLLSLEMEQSKVVMDESLAAPLGSAAFASPRLPKHL